MELQKKPNSMASNIGRGTAGGYSQNMHQIDNNEGQWTENDG